MQVKAILCKILFVVVTFLFALCTSLRKRYSRFLWHIDGVIAGASAYFSRDTSSDSGLPFALRDTDSYLVLMDIPKVPRHIVLLVNGPLCIESLSNVVSWCIAIGIPQVSLYDPAGNIVRNNAVIEKEVRRKIVVDMPPEYIATITPPRTPPNVGEQCHKVMPNALTTHKMDLLNPLVFLTPSAGVDNVENRVLPFSSNNGSENSVISGTLINSKGEVVNMPRSSNIGDKEKAPIDISFNRTSACVVNFLDRRTGGRETVVNIARKFCEESRMGLRNPDSINVKTFNEAITEGEDPDVALIFGPVLTMSGFLPWHIRLTEMIYMGVLEYTCPTDFRRAMYRFNECVHRYGR
eukprot:CFRG6807T1